MLHWLLITAGSLSASPQGAEPHPLDGLADCRAIAADAARLACFDRVAATIATARRGGDLIVVDRKEAVERRRARFGLSTVTGNLGDDSAELSELDTVVREVRASSTYGRHDLALANGTVWQTVEAVPFPPRPGSAIKLRAARLGGYRASVGGGRTFLVKRLR